MSTTPTVWPPSDCDLEAICRARSIRHATAEPWLRKAGTRPASYLIEATDGHICASVPVQVTDDPSEGLLPAAALRIEKIAADEGAGLMPLDITPETVSCGATSWPRPTGTPPDVGKVIDDAIRKTETAASNVTIRLNATLLARLAAGLGCELVELTVAVNKDGTTGEVVVVRPSARDRKRDGRVGAIMQLVVGS